MSIQGHHFVRNTETGKDLVPADAASNRGTYYTKGPNTLGRIVGPRKQTRLSLIYFKSTLPLPTLSRTRSFPRILTT